MANEEHLKILMQGVAAWNAWRIQNPEVTPNLNHTRELAYANLSGANLSRTQLGWTDLRKANLSGADLREANLSAAILIETNLSAADLRKAILSEAVLPLAILIGTNLREATVARANFTKANLNGADLREANLNEANLSEADLTEANLKKANLKGANFYKANLSKADFTGANLSVSNLVGPQVEGANLTDCHIYGISVWDIEGEPMIQSGLVITPDGDAAITVDNLRVAQFIYLLLNNEEVRHVIDTITSKVILILGRFTDERKKVIDAIREELRKEKYDYVPIVFDFTKPSSQTTRETVTTLAGMARFVIADVTDAKSVLQELEAIVPTRSSLPIRPILLASQDEPGMFDSFRPYPWFLPAHPYQTAKELVEALPEVIAPAEAKALEIREGMESSF